jgi:GNAT superfamily N-acetyltransferase
VPSLIEPHSPPLWDIAAGIVDEYVASLQFALAFQNFAHERTHLAEEYGPPDGQFLLATEGSVVVGCGAIRRFSDDACEMKRLYVRPSGRGRGVGRMISEALIQTARERGYRTMLLDTVPSMQHAMALYAALGFQPVAPYRFSPVAGATFLKLDL